MRQEDLKGNRPTQVHLEKRPLKYVTMLLCSYYTSRDATVPINCNEGLAVHLRPGIVACILSGSDDERVYVDNFPSLEAL